MLKILVTITMILLLTGCSKVGVKVDIDVVPSSESQTLSIVEESAPSEIPLEYPKVLTPSQIERIQKAYYSEGQFGIFNGEKYGFMNENGVEITQYSYEFAYPFSEGLACVYIDGKYGFIDYEGKEAFPFMFDKANPFSGGLAYFENGERYGFIDKTGEEVFILDCDSVSSFQEGYAYFSIDGKYGYIDNTGREVIKPIYDDADYFKDGLATVRMGSKMGVIDLEENEIVPAQFDEINIEAPFIMTTSNTFNQCFNREGDLIPLPEYDTIDISGNYLTFKVGDKYGLADERGSIIMNPEFTFIRVRTEYELAVIRNEKKEGIIDLDGNILIDLKYDSIFLYNQNYAKVNIGEKYGVIDLQGNTVIAVEYDNIYMFNNGKFAIEEYGRYYIYDMDENRLLDTSYDKIEKFGKSFYYELDLKHGFMDENGKEVFHIDYEGKSIEFKRVYNSAYMLFAWVYYGSEPKHSIIITDDRDEIDLSDIFLKDEITSRIKLFYDYMKTGQMEIDGDEGKEFTDIYKGIVTFKLYNINGSSMPVLYISKRGCSGFYGMNHNQVNTLISGEMSGSRAGNVFVSLFFDKETSNIVLGKISSIDTSWRSSSKIDVYNYKNDEVNQINSYEQVYERPIGDGEETSPNYFVMSYLVDDKQSSIDEYNKISERFEFINLVSFGTYRSSIGMFE